MRALDVTHSDAEPDTICRTCLYLVRTSRGRGYDLGLVRSGRATGLSDLACAVVVSFVQTCYRVLGAASLSSVTNPSIWRKVTMR